MFTKILIAHHGESQPLGQASTKRLARAACAGDFAQRAV